MALPMVHGCKTVSYFGVIGKNKTWRVWMVFDDVATTSYDFVVTLFAIHVTEPFNDFAHIAI